MLTEPTISTAPHRHTSLAPITTIPQPKTRRPSPPPALLFAPRPSPLLHFLHRLVAHPVSLRLFIFTPDHFHFFHDLLLSRSLEVGAHGRLLQDVVVHVGRHHHHSNSSALGGCCAGPSASDLSKLSFCCPAAIAGAPTIAATLSVANSAHARQLST